MPKECPACHFEAPEGAEYCPACGAPLNEHVLHGLEQQRIRAADELPMRWYKFLIYVSLPFSLLMALYNLYTGWQNVQSLDTAQFVSRYSALLATVLRLDMAVALALLAPLALAEVWLIRRQWRGVRMLLFLYAFQAVYGLLAVIILNREGIPIGMTVGSLLESAVMFFVNRAYFQRRRGLFS